METKPDLQTRLDKLRREYRGVRSMLEMMQKGTEASTLRKMREEKLDPIEREIREVEMMLKEDTKSASLGRNESDSKESCPGG